MVDYHSVYLSKAMQSGGNGFGYASFSGVGKYSSANYSSQNYSGKLNYDSNIS